MKFQGFTHGVLVKRGYSTTISSMHLILRIFRSVLSFVQLLTRLMVNGTGTTTICHHRMCHGVGTGSQTKPTAVFTNAYHLQTTLGSKSSMFLYRKMKKPVHGFTTPKDRVSLDSDYSRIESNTGHFYRSLV